MKIHQRVLVFAKQKKCVACSYHNEPFKTAVTVKEIINLKYENAKQENKKRLLKKICRAEHMNAF